MPKPVSITIPHQLGIEEARRRIDQSFGTLEQQMTGGLGILSFQKGWEGDRLNFTGGGLGQRITGRLDVRKDDVHIEIDLPNILAAIAETITGRLKQSTQKLLT